jgi:sulfonate transport system substrate-binding protein
MKKLMLSLKIFLIFFICFIVSSCDQGEKQTPSAKTTQQDLSSHPIYSNYNFDQSGKVISFGTQPLYMPTGLIIEVIKRDLLLKRELSTLDFKLQFFPFLKGKDVNFFMFKNDISVGVGGDMPALTLAARGDILIPTLIQNGPVSIVTKKHMLLVDLRGKNIGYASGSLAHYALLDSLSSVGLSVDEVRLVPLEVNEMVESLNKGQISAYAAWEPTPELGKKQYSFVKGHQSMSSGFLYFNNKFFKIYPEVLYLIIAAELRAINWIKSSKENLKRASQWALNSAESILGRETMLSIRDYTYLAEQDILGRNSTKFYGINENSLKKNGLLHSEFQFLKNLGTISADAKWEKVINSFRPEIVQEIIKEKNKYKLQEFDYK